MSYTITNSRGLTVATIADGTTDSTSTPLTLIGKNFINYGTAFNQNLVRSLENFAKITAPSNPVVGQLWYDLSTKILKFYDDGGIWRTIGVHSPGVGSLTPAVSNTGDTQWDGNQFRVWNGSTWVIIGPTIGSLSLEGNIAAANVSATTATWAPTGYFGNLYVGPTSPSTAGTGNVQIWGGVIPATNNTYDLGNVAYQWKTMYGTALKAQYADLAENYETDAQYVPGTVVQIGGSKEITQVSTVASNDVWGVISTEPAFLMNSTAPAETHLPVALVGKVPVRVIGSVNKGDPLISAGNGVARSAQTPDEKAVCFGRSLEDNFNASEKLVMVSIK